MLSPPTLQSDRNLPIPALIYGTAWKKQRTADLVEHALTLGFRGIDTACQPRHYHEPGVGEALQRLAKKGLTREAIYLQTKFTPLSGQDPQTVPYDPEASFTDQVLQSFAVSQRNLDTEYVDGLILHSPLIDKQSFGEVWRAMEQIVGQGGARHLGISNCYDLAVFQWLYEFAEIKPSFLQNRFYAQTDYDQTLRQWCRSQRVLYQSFWTLTANTAVLGSLTLAKLADKYGCEPTQIFLRYVSQLGIIPLTGTCNPEHMRDDLAMFSFELDAEEMSAIGVNAPSGF